MAQFIELGYCCGDCGIAIANNDYTGMSDERAAEVQAALESTCKEYGWLITGGYESDNYWQDCFVCGARIGETFALFADTSVLASGGAA